MLNHLGCPLFGKGTAADEAMLRTWREGVTALSMVPHTNVKLSAISYIREVSTLALCVWLSDTARAGISCRGAGAMIARPAC